MHVGCQVRIMLQLLETKVVEMLKERGISKKDINRDEFMKYDGVEG